MKKRILAAVLVLSVTGLMLTGCADTRGDGTVKVGISIQSLSNAYWAGVMGKLEEQMEAKGWDYTIVGCDNNAGTQVGQVENFIISGCDLIMVHPADAESLEGICGEAMEADIKVMCWDDPMENTTANVNVLCAYLMVHKGVPMALAIIITLAASTLIGVLNGFMVSTIGIPALIATFATQTAFSGIALIICDGQPINGFTEAFKVFGQGKIGPVPVPVVIMILCFALGAFILNKTYFGRYFYAVGGNIEAVCLSPEGQAECQGL